MPQLARTETWLLAAVLLVASTPACGDDDAEPSHSAGSGGRAGDGGTSGGGKSGGGKSGGGKSGGGKSGGGGLGGAGAAGKTVGDGGDGGGVVEPACRTDVACADSGISFLDCPSRLEDLDLRCRQYITIDRYLGCDGSVIRTSNGIQTSSYSFDVDGKLVGTRDTGDVGDTACFGQPCGDLGTREVLCDGSAGVGGAGGAGMGGEAAGG